MTGILTALGSGVSAKKILEFLMKKSPDLAPRITQALASGLSAEKVVKFFSKDKNFNKLKQSMEEQYPMQGNANPLVQAENIRGNNLATDSASALQRNLPGIAVGTAAAVASPYASRAAQYALSRALPNNLKNLSSGMNPTAAPSNMTGQPQAPSTSPSASGPMSPTQPTTPQPQTAKNALPSAPQQPPGLGNVTSVTQPQPITQPEGISINPQQSRQETDALWQRIQKGVIKHPDKDLNAFLKIANDLTKFSGLNREGFDKLYDEFIQKKQSGMPLDQIAKDMFAMGGEDEGKLPKGVPEEKTENVPIAKNETVATPHGVGEVITSRNGKSLIEIDGKKHQVDDKSLLKPPKEAAIEALELIKGFTPEEMRSTHHMLNAYDEGEKKGFFVFHNGSAYVVDDITPEEYKELSEEVEKAKTTGETIIGKWASGEGSRGAGYNKVVKGVRERKVVPELKKKFRKLKVGYNLLAEWQRLLNEK